MAKQSLVEGRNNILKIRVEGSCIVKILLLAESQFFSRDQFENEHGLGEKEKYCKGGEILTVTADEDKFVLES